MKLKGSGTIDKMDVSDVTWFNPDKGFGQYNAENSLNYNRRFVNSQFMSLGQQQDSTDAASLEGAQTARQLEQGTVKWLNRRLQTEGLLDDTSSPTRHSMPLDASFENPLPSSFSLPFRGRRLCNAFAGCP
jgi:hypothetical protein